jgi:6-phosphogluconolactonase
MNTDLDVRVFPTLAELFPAAATEFTQIAQAAIRISGRFTVALSGGSTPKTLFKLLAGLPAGEIPWEKVYFFFGDERHVPPDDPESNFRMANESLLSKIHARPENVFRVQAELDAETAARNYEEQLIKFFNLQSGRFPRFDLIMLGLGPDGHTASLFPGSKGLEERQRLVIANWVQKLNAFRITFTYPVLNQAACVMFMATGADKADAVRRVIEDKKQGPPAGGVAPIDGRLLWFLDRDAAAELPTGLGAARGKPRRVT